MSDTAIRIEGIGKQYRIGLSEAGGRFSYKSLGETLSETARRPWKLVTDRLRSPLTDDNSFWALKDVSFEIKKGECVGIIGRNGAGKSTLLKILSRITKPTTGQIELHGRVGSLLEVGTGFHPELTGRENIFLNGAILGMTRAEVKAKFDEIVVFSEIERFLDTPVKQYSSGMYTRLAFAVAAHLEPEILVVDEVLAVGDAQFQKKCLGKMKDVAGEGRTVLFVSHNLGIIRSLCDSGVWLDHGTMRDRGDAESAVTAYLGDSSRRSEALAERIFQNGIALKRAELTIKGSPTTEVLFNDSATLEIEFESLCVGIRAAIELKLYKSGEFVGSANSPEEGLDWHPFEGVIQYYTRLPASRLMPGSYSVSIYVWEQGGRRRFLQEEALQFDIHPEPVHHAGLAYAPRHGVCRFAESVSLTTNPPD